MKSAYSLVIFRVDANSDIGAGHLMRCIALAHALKESGIGSHFVVDQRSASLLSSIAAFEFDFTPLNTAESDLSQIKACIEGLPQNLTLLALVLDGYQFCSDYRYQLKSLGHLLVILDDQNNSGALYADLVLNPLNAAKSMNYAETAPAALHLFGPGYVLLQPAFQRTEPADWGSRGHLLITFGASDVKDLSLPMLTALLNEEVPFQAITLITGAAYPHEQAIRQLLASAVTENTSINYLHQVDDMTQPMQGARLAISAAGSTQFELATLQIPTLLVVVADNQLAAAKEQEALGWCKVVDAREGLDVQTLLRQTSELWRDEARLLQMHQVAGAQNYKAGAHRVVRAILQAYEQRLVAQGINAYGVRLKPVQQTDLEMIRQWRNDPSVRQFMLDQTDISARQQQSWFASIRHDISQQHYVIWFKEQAIGVINIKSTDQQPLLQAAQIETGLYIYEPRYRNNFLDFCPSVAMLDYCFDVLACQQIVARVLPDNHAAINYNQQLGYTMQPEVHAANGLIHMQLDQAVYRAASRKIKALIRY